MKTSRPARDRRRRPSTPGLMLAGALLVLVASNSAMAAPAPGAPSPQEVTEACVKASNLHKPKPAGKPIGFDDQVGMTALVVDGQVMINRKKSRKGRVLCLFDKVTRNPFIADGNGLIAGYR